MASYRSSFTVSIAATDRVLVSPLESLEALGVSEETALIGGLCAQVSDMIARYCRVPEDGVKAPTLLVETIVETFRRSTRLETGAFPYPASQPDFIGLPLSRFPVQSVTSIVEDGVTLSGSNYEIDKARGYLNRLSNDVETRWTANKIVVTYSAGRVLSQEYGLKLAATKILREQYFAAGRDPSLRAETVEGIGSFQYDVSGQSSSSFSGISAASAQLLAPYVYPMQ